MSKYDGIKYYLNNVNHNLSEQVVADIFNLIAENEAFQEAAASKTKRKRPAAVNKSGVVQVDTETGKEIQRFKTIKEANIAIGKAESASGISDAVVGRTSTHYAYGYKWYHTDEWDAMNQE